jgi:hypothetical protein
MPSTMDSPKSVDSNINQSALYKELVAKLEKLENFDNDVVGGMEVINQMPKFKAMIVPGKHVDLGIIVEAAKTLLRTNINKLSNPDAAKETRLKAIKEKLEILYNYEQNPALGNQTLMSMPVYAEKMTTGKAVNMNAIIAEAIQSTESIIEQLERTNKN